MLFCVVARSFTAMAQPAKKIAPVRVLVVIAHPDDESVLSVTLYKIAKEQGGVVDLFVITNGEAGFKYSTLAEAYYGVKLTDEKTGRSRLPEIRKKELKNAGKILGISNYYFCDQRDEKYCLDEKQSMDSCWHTADINAKLRSLLSHNQYDFLFCLLPDAAEHGAHKAATILALRAVASLPAAKRPCVMGVRTRNKADSLQQFSGYSNYEETRTIEERALFKVDRTTGFSYHNKVNYKVIANWEIAEHKSQGATQMTMNDGDLEEFWYFRQNGNEGVEKCNALFRLLEMPPYMSKVY